MLIKANIVITNANFVMTDANANVITNANFVMFFIIFTNY